MVPASPSALWTRRPERGSLPLVRFMVWLSLALGRGATRVLVRAIAAYFFASSASARGAIRAYRRRVMGREPRLREVFASFFAFASTIHDRVYFLGGRIELFDVQIHGAEHVARGEAVLLGAHLGSFEALRAAGRHIGQRRVAMAMYEENARRLNGVLAAINPEVPRDIVALGHVGSMLELRARLDAGDLVGVLADRTLGDEPVVLVPFLGEPAPFPTGPMRMAAALRQRVFLMVGLYRGGNRYEVFLEPLADFSGADDPHPEPLPFDPCPRGVPGEREEREQRVKAAIVKYVERLEHYCRMAPDNWFNFHDFWGQA